MIGHTDDETADGLLQPRLVDKIVPSQNPRMASMFLLVPCLLVVGWYGSIPSATSSAATNLLAVAAGHTAWPKVAYGVSLGGWLVMEINPSTKGKDAPLDLRPQWMYDQVEAKSELDFVLDLRREHGDAFAIQTMKNHWEGYYTEPMIDAAKALGVNAMRVPVGYWIMDKPVGGSSPLEYGISPEGFVTGGLNSLYTMLVALRKRGIAVQLDMHAMVCNSACVSDGMYCAQALAFAPPGTAPIGEIPRCGGGTYKTTRVPSAGEASWGDVGVNAVGALAEWVAALPAEAAAVAALQLANEPALAADGGLGGPSKSKEDAVNTFYQGAIEAVRPHLPSLPLILSFIPPSAGVMTFLEGLSSSAPHMVDHHFYLNWLDVDPATRVIDPTNPDDPKCCMPWAEIHRRACAGSKAKGVGWQVYVEARQKLIIGEWSLAVNHDQRLDLTDYETRYNLRRLYQEQLETFSATPGFSGAFFWTLRMGSGWDPRPTKAHPHGRQVDGSSAWRSLPGYPFPVWSLLEMGVAGVATPLNLSYTACSAPTLLK